MKLSNEGLLNVFAFILSSFLCRKNPMQLLFLTIHTLQFNQQHFCSTTTYFHGILAHPEYLQTLYLLILLIGSSTNVWHFTDSIILICLSPQHIISPLAVFTSPSPAPPSPLLSCLPLSSCPPWRDRWLATLTIVGAAAPAQQSTSRMINYPHQFVLPAAHAGHHQGRSWHFVAYCICKYLPIN